MIGQFKNEIPTLSDIGLQYRYNPYTHVFDDAIIYNKRTYDMHSNENSNSRIYPKENSIVFHKNNDILGDNCFTRLHTIAPFTLKDLARISQYMKYCSRGYSIHPGLSNRNKENINGYNKNLYGIYCYQVPSFSSLDFDGDVCSKYIPVRSPISSSLYNPITDYIGNRRKSLNLVRRKMLF